MHLIFVIGPVRPPSTDEVGTNPPPWVMAFEENNSTGRPSRARKHLGIGQETDLYELVRIHSGQKIARGCGGSTLFFFCMKTPGRFGVPRGTAVVDSCTLSVAWDWASLFARAKSEDMQIRRCHHRATGILIQ
uniref:Uncharacterized protein n=1 Tax=Octactis speculum TaxID=3111310 RepID=A0A7S2G9P8_9STRA